MLFYKYSTDGTKIDSDSLCASYGSIEPTPIWILGSSDTLTDEEYTLIKESDIPVFGVNYSGRGKDGEGWKVKPNFWTAFDSSPRFHKSIFLDSTIMKFVKDSRQLDLIPGTNHKLCDSPNTYFFPCDNRKYDNYFDDSVDNINHSLDSFIQALDIAYRLGFRKFYCVNTEMIIRLSQSQIGGAKEKGVEYENGQVKRVEIDQEGKPHEYWSDLLTDFVVSCLENRVAHTDKELYELMESLDRENQYSFSEKKSFYAAVMSDKHYWERVQYLRLSRKNMVLKGVQLFTCSKTSRLYPWFPYKSVEEVCQEHNFDTRSESTVGLYSGKELKDDSLPFHRDIKPYNSNMGRESGVKVGEVEAENGQGIKQMIVDMQINDKLKLEEVL